MHKFKPGDPVWARRSVEATCPSVRDIAPGEYAGIVVETLDIFSVYGWPVYKVDVLDFRRFGLADCDERFLRLRRDDYQQHEGLGSIDSLRQPGDATEKFLEELCERAAGLV